MTYKKQGFSLIEMLFVMSIICGVIVLSIPSIKSLIAQMHHRTASSQLLRAINTTRTEAMTRGAVVSLCKSVDQKNCSGEWGNGYIISSNHEILYTFQTNSQGSLQWRGYPRYLSALEFLPTGVSNEQNGSFVYCEKKSVTPAWVVVVNKSGRARLAKPDAQGVIYDDAGEAIHC